MIFGDPKKWTEKFKRLDDRFLECVLAVWEQCVARLPEDPYEDAITINLVKNLRRNTKARRLFHHLGYQHDPVGNAPGGWVYSKGKMDMVLLLDPGCERYLAYECKRLNVSRSRNGGIDSLAGNYVRKGILRFVTEQYAEHLPVGCMMGYVLDGNMNSAQSKVRDAIDTHKVQIGLVEGPMDEVPIGFIKKFASRHCRPSSGTYIELRHAFLPFPEKPQKGAH